MFNIEHRLATYGTLAPGRPNHHQLDGLVGTWSRGTVHGRLLESGWGAAMGFPGMVLDSDGPAIEVHLFESADLPAHWARLDHFEGPGYRRSEVAVETDNGTVMAYLYLLAP